MRRDPREPPPLPAAVLWRSLLPRQLQRPILYRLRAAEATPLFVRAAPAMAEALSHDAGERAAGVVEALLDTTTALELLSLVLHTPRGRAFPSAGDLAELEEHEIRELASQTRAVLADIAPTTARSNVASWRAELERGAEHPSNIHEASVLATCVDVTPGGILPRPDRYWGLPLCELLDGHWLAWQAARTAMKDRK
jgi:hypothetical protein